MSLMKIAPSFLPDLRSVRPPLAIAREQHFERFGKARLPRTVAADDDRQTRTRDEREGLFRSNASEALNRHGGEIGARVFLRSGRRGRLGCCFRIEQDAFNRVMPIACGEHEAAPVLL
jgi:hypothetical protein